MGIVSQARIIRESSTIAPSLTVRPFVQVNLVLDRLGTFTVVLSDLFPTPRHTPVEGGPLLSTN